MLVLFGMSSLNQHLEPGECPDLLTLGAVLLLSENVCSSLQLLAMMVVQAAFSVGGVGRAARLCDLGLGEML